MLPALQPRLLGALRHWPGEAVPPRPGAPRGRKQPKMTGVPLELRFGVNVHVRPGMFDDDYLLPPSEACCVSACLFLAERYACVVASVCANTSHNGRAVRAFSLGGAAKRVATQVTCAPPGGHMKHAHELRGQVSRQRTAGLLRPCGHGTQPGRLEVTPRATHQPLEPENGRPRCSCCPCRVPWWSGAQLGRGRGAPR